MKRKLERESQTIDVSHLKKNEVHEDENKSSSDASSEEERTTKGKKTGNNLKDKNGNKK